MQGHGVNVPRVHGEGGGGCRGGIRPRVSRLELLLLRAEPLEGARSGLVSASGEEGWGVQPAAQAAVLREGTDLKATGRGVLHACRAEH